MSNVGKITIKGNRFNDAELQRNLLLAEGIEVVDFSLEMQKYRFRADVPVLKLLKFDPLYIDIVLIKYQIG